MTVAQQYDLFVPDYERTMLDGLISRSKLYHDSQSYKELLDFVARLRNFSPFNAMLLQVQRPGLSYAASEHDWHSIFRRWPRLGARPLLILRPFGPVSFVYDIIDTEGEQLPEDVWKFSASTELTDCEIEDRIKGAATRAVRIIDADCGDDRAGCIRRPPIPPGKRPRYRFEIMLNQNHSSPVRFATLAHELAHLYLGHIGADKGLKIKPRRRENDACNELEAESAAYIVCRRHGILSHSEKYLASWVSADHTIEDVDIYQVMTAAYRVEKHLTGQDS